MTTTFFRSAMILIHNLNRKTRHIKIGYVSQPFASFHTRLAHEIYTGRETITDRDAPLLSARIFPLWASTMPLAMDRPRP